MSDLVLGAAWHATAVFLVADFSQYSVLCALVSPTQSRFLRRMGLDSLSSEFATSERIRRDHIVAQELSQAIAEFIP